jgi:uncharacterized protein
MTTTLKYNITNKYHLKGGYHLIPLLRSIFLFQFLLLSASSFAQVTDTLKTKDDLILPERVNRWVNDFQGLFSKAQEQKLDSLIDAFEKKTTIEIVIVTFDSTWVKADKFDRFVIAIHNNWGVGKEGINNGIVLGFSTDLRVIRISNGYGIEKILSDQETSGIINKVITPEFRQQNYYEGIYKGVLALISRLR